MPQLLFKREFAEAIRLGRKSTTLRRWKTARVVAGQRVKVPGVGWLAIMACEKVELAELGEADARADGFPDRAHMLAALGRLYPEQAGDGRGWYRVRFRLEQGEGGSGTSDKKRDAGSNGRARLRVARRLRAELDKAVRRNGSLFPL